MDREEPIIEACLEEVLGGIAPPDLTSRILQALSQRKHLSAAGSVSVDSELSHMLVNGSASEVSPVIEAPPVAEVPVVVVPIIAAAQLIAPNAITPNVVTPASVQARRGSRTNSSAPSLPKVAIAASLLIATGVLGTIAWRVANRGVSPEVVTPVGGKKDIKPTTSTNSTLPHKNNNPPNTARDLVEVPRNSTNRTTPKSGRIPRDEAHASLSPGLGQDPGFGKRQPNVDEIGSPVLAARQQVPAGGSSDAQVIAFINSVLADSWKREGVQPAPAASDSEWCRRVYLRIVGRIPTVDELQKFAEDKSDKKREQLVDQLLAGSQYAEEYAHNWTTIWANVLLGRRTDAANLASREGLEIYLRDSFLKNKPYDKLVGELLSATGSAKPGSDDFNGAVNFLLASYNDKATQATSKVCRTFLGMQLQCAQCHDHPNHEWGQSKFWQMNAFFRQMQPVRRGDDVRLVNRDFVGESNKSGSGKSNPHDAEIFYPRPSGRLEAAYPIFVDGTQIGRSGQVADTDRRAKLAELVAKSNRLEPTLVNRMWQHFLGFGFTWQIDDIGPHSAPSHPELVGRLSGEFAARGHDMKSLIRWIVLSDAFGLSSVVTPENKQDNPLNGSQPLFARYYARPMAAEQLYDSLMIAANARSKGTSTPEGIRARTQWLGKFFQAGGTPSSGAEEAVGPSIFDGGVNRKLEMFNGELIRGAANRHSGTYLARLIESKLPPMEKVEHLFLAALSRKPDERERQAIEKLLALHKGDSAAALEDIYAALLMSSEFNFDH